LPVHAFVVEHPSGTCLFDTGQTERAAHRGYHQWWHPFLWLARFELGSDDEVRAQVDPASVRWVVLSHLHTDHVGGLPAFTHATVVVSRTEWERSRGLGGRLRGYVPQHWPRGLEPVLVQFTGAPIGPFPGSHDLAGDGSLLLVPTAGHTPGHMALIVRGECLLGGDMAHSGADLAEAEPEIAEWCRQEHLAVLLAHDVV
jgi:N-acyl homoserine lactone hydrolase